jgi:outer membrane protein OmpA-like peptidoglycan-associated protein
VKAPAAPAAVKLYFDTGKSAVQTDAKTLLAETVKYGNASPNSKIQISGFHDKRGSAAANAELAKNRAKAVRDLLQAAGLAADRMILVPPVELVGSTDDREARRVDVSIAQ